MVIQLKKMSAISILAGLFQPCDATCHGEIIPCIFYETCQIKGFFWVYYEINKHFKIRLNEKCLIHSPNSILITLFILNKL